MGVSLEALTFYINNDGKLVYEYNNLDTERTKVESVSTLDSNITSVQVGFTYNTDTCSDTNYRLWRPD